MNFLRSRTGLLAAVASLLVSSAGHSAAQGTASRAASPAALIAFPGFFHGQPVVVRGTLATRDQAVLISPAIDRSLPLMFAGPSPDDGPVEVRATFWDVGRFQRDDPRVQSLGLNRLLPNTSDTDWPRPGELVALVVTDAASVTPADGPPSLRLIALEPSTYVGQRVRITGQFRGRNLYGELPQAPGISQWDFVLHTADASVWVTGLRPRGKDFNLSVGARVDTNRWLQATGVVKEGRGLVWIEAQELALGKAEVETTRVETLPPPMGPPPEVIFADPEEGEADVPLKTVVRLQFSRDMNPETFKGRVSWRYGDPNAGAAAGTAGPEGPRSTQVRYDGARRALEVPVDADALARYRDVVVELREGITATDGAQLAPWTLTFMLGGQ